MIESMALAFKILMIILPLHGKPAHIKDIAPPMSFLGAMKEAEFVIATPKGGPVKWTTQPAFSDPMTNEMVSSISKDTNIKKILSKSVAIDKIPGGEYMFVMVVGSSEEAMKMPALSKFLKTYGKTGRPLAFWGSP